jgi:galactosyl transferase GMA12/MNN10 family
MVGIKLPRHLMAGIKLPRQGKLSCQQRLLFGVVLLMLATLFVGIRHTLIFGVREWKDSKVLIVSLSVGSGKDDYQQAMTNFESYAKCHGYDFLNAGTMISEINKVDVHPFMQKAFILQYIFSETTPEDYSKYDFILWVDRDAIFMNHHVSIAERLNQLHAATWSMYKYDLFIAVESWAWLNSGVLLFRNTKASKRLIDDWIHTYVQRQVDYQSLAFIHIGGVKKTFRDLFQLKWSCEDQGALIALLAGYNDSQKWHTDRFDGLGVPHVLHMGHDEWAAVSTKRILAQKYQKKVKIVAQSWINTNPWNHAKYKIEQGWWKSIDPFIYHFNGQNDKPSLIRQYSNEVKHCTRASYLK